MSEQTTTSHTGKKVVNDISFEIINGCKQKDPDCQKIVYEQYYEDMYVICLRYAVNSDEAKDLLHDGFIKLFKKIKSYSGEGQLFYWIRRLFINHCLDYVRSAYKKHIYYEDPVTFHSSLDSQEVSETASHEHFNDFSKVLNAMKKMRPDHRIVLNLFAFEQFSHQQIAAELGIKEVSSRSKLMRARNELVRILKEQGDWNE